MTTPDNVDDRVDAWHDGASDLPLHEYLGWTWAQYQGWVQSNVFPRDMCTCCGKPVGMGKPPYCTECHANGCP